jgi:hypothetical protein
MKRVVLPLLVLLGLLAVAPAGFASDQSLAKALKPYKSKLLVDVAYLGNFKAPSKSKAAAALKRLSTIKKDLTGAKNAAEGQQASTSKGTTGRTDVINGVTDMLTATSDAVNSAKAAKSGKTSAAKSDAKAEFKEVNKGIPPLEAGGTDLGLFG